MAASSGDSGDSGDSELRFCGVQTSLVLRNSNTLHGFNGFTDGTYVIVGCLDWSDMSTFNTRPSTESVSLAVRKSLPDLDQKAISTEFRFISGSYGGDLLQLPVSRRHLAGLAIDAVRKCGYDISLQTQLRPWFLAKDVGTVPFSIEAAERQVLPTLQSPYAKDTVKQKAYLFADQRLWSTKEGKQFANQLYKFYGSSVDIDTPIHINDRPLLQFPTCAFDFPPTPVTTPVTTKDEKMGKEKTPPVVVVGECVVCLGTVANTLVLPCMHCVVCEKCSIRLKSTPDANQCIQCRKPLTNILLIDPHK
jgi:hypothetical protein